MQRNHYWPAILAIWTTLSILRNGLAIERPPYNYGNGKFSSDTVEPAYQADQPDLQSSRVENNANKGYIHEDGLWKLATYPDDIEWLNSLDKGPDITSRSNGNGIKSTQLTSSTDSLEESSIRDKDIIDDKILVQKCLDGNCAVTIPSRVESGNIDDLREDDSAERSSNFRIGLKEEEEWTVADSSVTRDPTSSSTEITEKKRLLPWLSWGVIKNSSRWSNDMIDREEVRRGAGGILKSRKSETSSPKEVDQWVEHRESLAVPATEGRSVTAPPYLFVDIKQPYKYVEGNFRENGTIMTSGIQDTEGEPNQTTGSPCNLENRRATSRMQKSVEPDTGTNNFPADRARESSEISTIDSDIPCRPNTEKIHVHPESTVNELTEHRLEDVGRQPSALLVSHTRWSDKTASGISISDREKNPPPDSVIQHFLTKSEHIEEKLYSIPASVQTINEIVNEPSSANRPPKIVRKKQEIKMKLAAKSVYNLINDKMSSIPSEKYKSRTKVSNLNVAHSGEESGGIKNDSEISTRNAGTYKNHAGGNENSKDSVKSPKSEVMKLKGVRAEQISKLNNDKRKGYSETSLFPSTATGKQDTFSTPDMAINIRSLPDDESSLAGNSQTKQKNLISPIPGETFAKSRDPSVEEHMLEQKRYDRNTALKMSGGNILSDATPATSPRDILPRNDASNAEKIKVFGTLEIDGDEHNFIARTKVPISDVFEVDDESRRKTMEVEDLKKYDGNSTEGNSTIIVNSKEYFVDPWSNFTAEERNLNWNITSAVTVSEEVQDFPASGSREVPDSFGNTEAASSNASRQNNTSLGNNTKIENNQIDNSGQESMENNSGRRIRVDVESSLNSLKTVASPTEEETGDFSQITVTSFVPFIKDAEALKVPSKKASLSVQENESISLPETSDIIPNPRTHEAENFQGTSKGTKPDQRLNGEPTMAPIITLKGASTIFSFTSPILFSSNKSYETLMSDETRMNEPTDAFIPPNLTIKGTVDLGHPLDEFIDKGLGSNDRSSMPKTQAIKDLKYHESMKTDYIKTPIMLNEGPHPPKDRLSRSSKNELNSSTIDHSKIRHNSSTSSPNLATERKTSTTSELGTSVRPVGIDSVPQALGNDTLRVFNGLLEHSIDRPIESSSTSVANPSTVVTEINEIPADAIRHTTINPNVDNAANILIRPTTSPDENQAKTYESASLDFFPSNMDDSIEIMQNISRNADNTTHDLEPLNQWPVKHSAVVEGDLVLGGLMMVHEREDTITCGPVMPQGGVQALEAMLYTLDWLNDREIVPGVKIGAHILDDCDKDTYGLEMAVDFIKATDVDLKSSTDYLTSSGSLNQKSSGKSSGKATRKK